MLLLKNPIETQTLKYVIESKSDLNAENITKNTPLHFFLFQNNNIQIENLKILLENKANINAKNTYGHNPLMGALEHNASKEMIYYMIENKADINNIDKLNRNCLFYASKCEQPLEITKFFVENKVCINTRSDRKFNPLSNYVESSHCCLDTIKYLIDQKIDLDVEDKLPSPLNVSIRNERYDVGKLNFFFFFFFLKFFFNLF